MGSAGFRRSSVFALTLLLSACSATPTESDAKQAVSQRMQNEVGSTPFEIVSFTKTDGQQAEIQGVPTYTYMYSAKVSFPQGYRSECVQQGNSFAGFDCALGFANPMAMRPQPKGAVVDYSGSVAFQKTENGWRAM